MNNNLQSRNLEAGYQEEGDSLDLKALISKYLLQWKWFVLSVIICIIGAFIYLRYAEKQYEVTASILFKEDKTKGRSMMASGPGGMALDLQNFGVSTTNNVKNELDILTSKSLVKKAVLALGAHVNYVVKGRVHSQQIFYDLPIQIAATDSTLNELKKPFNLVIKIPKEDNALQLKWVHLDEEQQLEVKTLPAIIQTPIGPLSITKTSDEDWEKFKGKPLFVSIVSPISKAKALLKNLNMALTDKMSSVVEIRFKTIDPKWGTDFINQLLKTYNEDANLDKNLVAQKTEEFINDRLKIISDELGTTERKIEETKQAAGFTALSDLGTVVRGQAEADLQLVKINTQLRIMEYLRDNVRNPKNATDVIPNNVGLEDVSLTTLINQYNEALIERNKLARSASETSPMVVQKTEDLHHLRESIVSSIKNAYSGLVITERSIRGQANKLNSKISNAPTQERILMDINRQQEIKAQLFLMLMQKREENSIAMAATSDNAKIIDDAISSDRPISPKKNIILLAAFILGLIIPIIVIFLLDFFRTKIENHAEVEKLSKMPLLGDVPFDENIIENSVQVRKNVNNIMAEVFRTLRTNLQFTLEQDDKIIIVTSTTSGEGKSLISTNLAVSMAILGKKVAIIGMDIRNPQLHKTFKFSNPPRGLTNLIADQDLNYNAIMIKKPEIENLSILSAGTIPPNPAELLDRPILKTLLDKMRQEFDYIIIDSAPVGLVVDTMIVSKYADATIYVCRENYTEKTAFSLINDLYIDGKFHKPGLVLNGVDLDKMARNRYGYGKRYGYGYGYGYGHQSEKRKKKTLLYKLKAHLPKKK